MVDFSARWHPGLERWPFSLLRLCLKWQLLFLSF